MGSINPLGFDIVRFAAFGCVRLFACDFALLLSVVRFVLSLRFVVASDYEKKGNYINFYLDTKVLEHIYPDNFIYIFIIDRYV
jgi:hypothetical protein